MTAVRMVPEITAKVTGAEQVAEQLGRMGERAASRGYSVTRHFGALLQAEIRARARQLFAVTDYDAHIALRMSARRYFAVAEVGTDDPQGYRLEFGFVGVDNRGAHIHQAPAPHFRPALAAIGPAYAKAISELTRP